MSLACLSSLIWSHLSPWPLQWSYSHDEGPPPLPLTAQRGCQGDSSGRAGAPPGIRAWQDVLMFSGLRGLWARLSLVALLLVFLPSLTHLRK